MPRRRTQLRPTTAHRYAWMIEHYICPRIGAVPLRRLRVDHLDQLYADLLDHGGLTGAALASKTVYDVHVIVRSALADATRRQLVDVNVALLAQAPRSQPRARRGPETWTAIQLRAFLDSAHHLRLYPALHLAAMTGMRRGELAGLRWGDWDQRRTSGVGGSQPPERRRPLGRSRRSRLAPAADASTSTRPPRPSSPPGAHRPSTRRTSRRAGRPRCSPTPQAGRSHAESISQLFDRHLARTGLPRIRFHDLRHTHASLLVAAGTPIKVVSERLGHAHPGFTMATYQHLVPGMSADAAARFADLIATA